MRYRDARLSEGEIHRLYEMLGMANEEQRKRILDELYTLRQKNDDTPIRIRGDSVTTPYTDSNA
jgi:hypothetical protein